MNISKLTQKMLVLVAFSIAAQAVAMDNPAYTPEIMQTGLDPVQNLAEAATVETLAQDVSSNVGPQVITPGMLSSMWNIPARGVSYARQAISSHPKIALSLLGGTAALGTGAYLYNRYYRKPAAKALLAANALLPKKSADKNKAQDLIEEDQQEVAKPRFSKKAKFGTAAGTVAVLGAGAYVANRYGYMPSIPMPSMETVKSAVSASVEAVKAAPAAVYNYAKENPYKAAATTLTGVGAAGIAGTLLYNRNSVPPAPAVLTPEEIAALAPAYQAIFDEAARKAKAAAKPQVTAKDAAKAIAAKIVTTNVTSVSANEMDVLKAIVAAETQNTNLKNRVNELISAMEDYNKSCRNPNLKSSRAASVKTKAATVLNIK